MWEIRGVIQVKQAALVQSFTEPLVQRLVVVTLESGRFIQIPTVWWAVWTLTLGKCLNLYVLLFLDCKVGNFMLFLWSVNELMHV